MSERVCCGRLAAFGSAWRSGAALSVVAALGLLSGACGGGRTMQVGGATDGGRDGDGGPSSTMDGGTICAEADRKCAHEFLWPGTVAAPTDGTDPLVEVIGDYRDGAWMQGDKMTWDASARLYRVTVPLPWKKSVIYKFHISQKGGGQQYLPDPNNPTTVPDGFNGVNSVLAGLTCTNYSCAMSMPPIKGAFDWRDAVLYFVFVDRFVDGNAGNNGPATPSVQPPANWMGGDWAGVTQKINDGYFNALGVNTLWLTVPMDNTDGSGIGTDGRNYSAYHGYWPRDLTKTEARFGTQAELKALVDAAHAAQLKIVLDYAMNHVHEDSPVWQMHRNDGWFNPLMVNGQQCLCGSNTCPWDGPSAKYCWFDAYLPDFNFNNQSARAYSVDNALGWIKSSGADGFRLDAVKHIELQWLLDLRSRLSAEVEPSTKQHVYLVGETFAGDRNLIKSFVDPSKMLDGQFDFPLRAQMIQNVLVRQGSLKDLVSFMDGNTGFYGSGAIMSTFIGNHDVPRAIHFAEDSPVWNDPWSDGKDKSWSSQPAAPGGTNAYERLSVAMALLLTNRGIPLIYYGDEIGMPGAGDPDNRRMMQWSSASPGPMLLLNRVKKLGAARAAHSALRRGDRSTLYVDDDAWAYSMIDGSDRVYVVVNRGDQTKVVGNLPSVALKDAITGDSLMGPMVTIAPRGVRVLVP